MTPEPHYATIPASWNAITLGQFVDVIELLLEPNPPYREVIKLLVPEIGKVNASEEGRLTEALSFLPNFAQAYKQPVPETLTILGVTIAIPQQLSSETSLIQWWSLDEEIENSRFPAESHLDIAVNAIWVISIYLYPLVFGQRLH
jgi:hypothetical protein